MSTHVTDSIDERMDSKSDPDAERVLIGTWRLLAWEAHASDGTVSKPFGDQPIGYLVYTPEGYVFVQGMRPSRSDFKGGQWLGGTLTENAQAFQDYVAYGGTFEVQDGMVVHHVNCLSSPTGLARTCAAQSSSKETV